jgi:UDP-glucose 4-epimerase
MGVAQSAYAGKPVLVTGGLGFIGSNLAIRLVELGAEVTVVDSLVPYLGGNPFNLAPVEDQVRVSTADLRDTAAVDELAEGQDVVFSVAGNVSHVDSMTDPIRDLEINCRSQLSLLEALRRRNPEARVVFAGSR